MSVPNYNPLRTGYSGTQSPQGATPYQGSVPYPGGIPQPYDGVSTEAGKKKIPIAFFFGIATWVAILLIIGVTALMIANSADESASARDGIAIIPMFGSWIVVLPLTIFGLATGASAKKHLMTRKQLIMNRIGFWLSIAPFVVFFLFYACIVIASIVERGV